MRSISVGAWYEALAVIVFVFVILISVLLTLISVHLLHLDSQSILPARSVSLVKPLVP